MSVEESQHTNLFNINSQLGVDLCLLIPRLNVWMSTIYFPIYTFVSENLLLNNGCILQSMASYNQANEVNEQTIIFCDILW
jgi:hypothetical protein